MDADAVVNPLAPEVVRLGDVDDQSVAKLLARFGLQLRRVPAHTAIPGSYWGDCEAGLIAEHLYARIDTPLHSILHEACHWITCTAQRRANLHTNAADCEAEEGASCYLQIVLADDLPGFGQTRALIDMDAWGYSFRLGSAKAWFEQDAQDAQDWLQNAGLIDLQQRPTYRVRQKDDPRNLSWTG